MGFDEFRIILDTSSSHIYHPGELVVGQVHLKVSSDIDLSKGIHLTIFGYGHVHWTETPQGNSLHQVHQHRHHDPPEVQVTGHEEFFEESFDLTATHEQTSYPFSMRIPHKPCLPWSATTEYGKVEYGVRAEIKRPWYKLNKSVSILFTLNSRIDAHTSFLGGNPYFSATCITNTKETKVGCCCIPFCCWYYCCSKEKVEITLRLHSSWANPGKLVPFTLVVDNRATNRELGIGCIQLIKVTFKIVNSKTLDFILLHCILFAYIKTWTHIGNHGKKVKSCETCLLEEPIEIGLPAGEEMTKEGAITFPEDLMPTQVECTVLKLTYKLKVTLILEI